VPLPSLADMLPAPRGLDGLPLSYVAGGLGALLVLFLAWRLLRRRRSEYRDLEAGLREDLDEYPPAPPGAARLLVNGVPGRLRLVVVAPTGKLSDPITLDDVPELLDRVHKGLGSLVDVDKPRVKVWPAPLSSSGFGPTFHRVVRASGKQWVKLAGPARTGRRPVLLGLAVWTDNASGLGDVVVEPTEWGELLHVF
jgi:hypothetical protein